LLADWIIAYKSGHLSRNWS